MDSIDAYIAKFPKDVREKLNHIRQLIRELLPEASEKMTYGVPAFTINDRTVVNYAAFKKHIGLYPGPEVIEKNKHPLKDYKTSRGTIQFPLDQEMPYDLINKIIKSINPSN